MSENKFFDETTEQSEVKTKIVSKYFWAWAKVIIPTAKRKRNRIAYIDLFAGPGRYKDGTKSTPLLVLEQAIADDDMREMLITVFNDKNAGNTRSLQKAIDSLPGIETLRNKPAVRNEEVGEKIVRMFEEMQQIPTLFFVDPWGYKGLSLRLVNSVLKNWGCDCIFFFNYNRINMGLENDLVKEHMDALFGEARAVTLRRELQKLDPSQRELLIVEELTQALKEMGGEYPLPFRFKSDTGKRTSHHLIFVTKNFKGYEIMKEIMAKESTSVEQGVANFEYNPADARYPTLFELNRPLDDLETLLIQEFSGKTKTVEEIYKSHSVGTPYIKRNYKDILIAMEEKGKVVANPPAANRRKQKGKVSMADSVRITFTPRKDS